jgi:Zn-dependent protease
VALREARITPWQQARVALAGLLAGALGAVAALAAAEAAGSRLLSALAYSGFLLNLLNMIPLGFLDGGQIARSYRYLRLGGGRGRAALVAAVALGLAVLLALGMAAAHVGQDRL